MCSGSTSSLRRSPRSARRRRCWNESARVAANTWGSLLASAITVANSVLLEQAVLAPDRVATGNRAQVAGPADIFATSDGWIIVQVVGQSQFRRWVRLVGDEELLDDPRFATDASRGDHRDELCDGMAVWCAERTTAQALDELATARIPAGPVLSPQQALDHPHITGLLRPTPYPGVSVPPPVADTPVSFGATESGIGTRARVLGNTHEILAELGYGDGAIAPLRTDGIV